MFGLDRLEVLFVIWAFIFQFILIIHFSLRKWHFEIAKRYGPIVYALGIPAMVISILLQLSGKPWFLWMGGFIYLVWGIYGYWIEYVKKIQWRNPPRWGILIPYILLYLSTIMFYWWPLAFISKPLWYVYAVLFVISTALNATSHKGPKNEGKKS
jgi:hypothetical protein